MRESPELLNQKSPLRLLVVDDDVVDQTAIRRVFARQSIPYELHTASDGEAALEVLRGEDEGSRLERPFIVLLDLRMPRMDGFEFLEELRRDSNLRDVIVFVLSTSDLAGDRRRAYDHNVAGYVLKSADTKTLQDLADLIGQYSRVVILPGLE